LAHRRKKKVVVFSPMMPFEQRRLYLARRKIDRVPRSPEMSGVFPAFFHELLLFWGDILGNWTKKETQ